MDNRKRWGYWWECSIRELIKSSNVRGSVNNLKIFDERIISDTRNFREMIIIPSKFCDAQ